MSSLDKPHQVPSHSAVHPQKHMHPISLGPLHPIHQLAWPDIYWCWHTAMWTCTCSSCWYQNHKVPKSADVSDDTIPCSAQDCYKATLTETFAGSILEKQPINAFIPLGNEKTKLPNMTRLHFLPEKLWHRRRKLMFAAYPQKHLRLSLPLAKRKKSSQKDLCTMQSSFIQRTQDEESKYCFCRGRGWWCPAFLWYMSLLENKRKWKL